MNLQDMRAAADIITLIDRDTLAPTLTVSAYAKLMQARDYILATIPPDADAPVTADTLKSWGFLTLDGMAWNHKQLTGTFGFEDGYLSWWHIGNRTAVITTRHQFSQLMTALGITPRGITPKEGV